MSDHVARAERVVLAAARQWWLGHRPVCWSAQQHREHPTINAHDTGRSERLARAVGRLERVRQTREESR